MPESQGLDGLDFVSLLNGSGTAMRSYNYSEFVGTRANGWTVREERMKLIVFEDGTSELYDLEIDPMENTNLIDQTGSYSELVAELLAFGAGIRG